MPSGLGAYKDIYCSWQQERFRFCSTLYCVKSIKVQFEEYSFQNPVSHHFIFWPHLSHVLGWSLCCSLGFDRPASVFLASILTSFELLSFVGRSVDDFCTSFFLLNGEGEDRSIRVGLRRGAEGGSELLEGLLLLVLLRCLNLIFLLAINLSLHDLSSARLIPTLGPSKTPLRMS